MMLITGASGGIGQILLEYFSDLGFECSGTYFSSEPKNDERLFKVDVRSTKEVLAWVESALGGGGHSEFYLINCAGISYNSLAHKADVELWRSVIETNLIGTFNAIHAILPHMRAGKHGRIINFSSVVGQKAVPGTSAYAASKSALWGMTRAIALENANQNITVNSINLGYSDVGIISEVPPEQLLSISQSIPIGRLGRPSNIIKMVEFILMNDDICGSSLDMNGGLY
jgi:NAD(P)-dependent dehydrogenase (short-subunit alcohol dehydrogenase family)